MRAGKFPFKTLEREVLPLIAALNGPAMELALQYELHGCTDVTGFGILGHAMEMSLGCGRHIVIDYGALPFYDGTRDMYRRGETTGSNAANRAMVARFSLRMARTLQPEEDEMLYDPQTSGGLLLALPADQADDLVNDLHREGIAAAGRVGEVTDGVAGLTVR